MPQWQQCAYLAPRVLGSTKWRVPGDGLHGLKTMNHIIAEHQGNAQTTLLYGQLLSSQQILGHERAVHSTQLSVDDEPVRDYRYRQSLSPDTNEGTASRFS